MPGGNGMGPAGWGPRTGRAAGFCAGYGVPGYANPAPGRGFGGRGGRGGRGGWGGGGWGRRGFWGGAPFYPAPGPYAAPGYGSPPVAPGDEIEALKAQAQYLQGELEAINKRLAELEQD